MKVERILLGTFLQAPPLTCFYLYSTVVNPSTNDNDNDFSTTRTMRTALAAARRLTASRAPTHAPIATTACTHWGIGRALPRGSPATTFTAANALHFYLCTSGASVELIHMLLVARRAIVASLAFGLGVTNEPAVAAPRAKGAAELDFEFYMRGVLGQPPPPPSAPAPTKEPRRLDARFATRALEAVEASMSTALSTSPEALRDAAIIKQKPLSLEYDRVLSSGAFGSGGYDGVVARSLSAPSFATQYDFDLTLLTLFSLLADARLGRAEAAEFTRQLGHRLLALVPAPSSAVDRSTPSAAPPRIGELVGGMRACLDTMQSAGYMASYAIDDSDADEALWAQRSALSATRLSVTLDDSASLRASLLLNGRSGASPDLARPLLMAYLTAAGADVSEASEYFLDGTYRPNPQDYRPEQQVIQMTIAPRAS